MIKRLLPLLLAVATLLIPISYAQKTGLGISDYEIKADLEVGETKKFEVARLYNTGDLNITITSTWIPNYNTSDIEVVITPNPVFLIPDQSKPLYAKVTAHDEIGTYSGIFDFACTTERPENSTGSPTEPGGSARATFTVITERPAEFIVKNLQVSPKQIYPGENVVVSFIVENIGDLEDSFSAKLLLDGEVAAEKNVTLQGQQSTTLSFTVSSHTPGNHTIQVANASQFFTVLQRETETEETEFPTIFVLATVQTAAFVVGCIWLCRRRKKRRR